MLDFKSMNSGQKMTSKLPIDDYRENNRYWYCYFQQKPLVTLSIPGSDEGLKFIFEDTDSNNDEVAALDIGKPIVIAGRNARSGSFGGVFLDDSILMSDMLSKELHKQRKSLFPMVEFLTE